MNHSLDTLQKEIKIFCSLVETCNFNQTAKNLKISQGTVSNALSRLEASCGFTLVLRSRHSFSLTPNGKLFYETCLTQQQQANKIFDDFFRHLKQNSKTLRACLSSGIAYQAISPYLGEFTVNNPQINLEIFFEHNLYAYNMNKYSTDIALFNEKMHILDNDISIEHLFDIRHGLYCSSQYIERYGKVECIDDLYQHRCIGYLDKDLKLREQLLFHDARGQTHLYKNDIRFLTTNNSFHSRAIVKGGHLIVFGYDAMFRQELETGEIIRVLPELTVWKMPIFLARRKNNRDAMIFGNFIKSCLQNFLTHE